MQEIPKTKKLKKTKKNIYLVLSVLLIVFFFTISAVCTQCGTPSKSTDTESTKEESKETDTAKTSSSSESETIQNEEQTNQTANETSETTESSQENEAPTIKLEIYEGPTYSAADDICYYRIKAIVTGKPKPAVKFSKDDSGGAWGEYKCQINISRGSSYTLTATAKNSVDTATATLNLDWGCGEENRNPQIQEILISDNNPKIGLTYVLSVNAIDLDNDSLTYKWTVSSGSLSSSTSNPTNWTAPATEGDCQIKVKVEDGKGGSDEKQKTVTVSLPPLPPAVVSELMPVILSETGYIAQGGAIVNVPGCVYAGDTNTNIPVQGFICFNISSLSGKTVDSASITFNLKKKWGEPSTVFGNLTFTTIDWGSGPPNGADFGISGTVIQSFPSSGTGSFTVNAAALKTMLQNAINDGKTKFQIRIHFTGSFTDSDGQWDGWEYDPSGISFNVSYY